jgi:hypothetical protein
MNAFAVADALRAITLGAAYTLKLDREIGSIECGKRADFCVLDGDPTSVPPGAAQGRAPSGARCRAAGCSRRPAGLTPDTSAVVIPTLILGGYLGAGKTTLVNHLLRHANGRRIAVMVNDFGELTIDADLIEGADGKVLALAGGCVCCSFGSDLVGALQDVSRRDPPPDLILIETERRRRAWRRSPLSPPVAGLTHRRHCAGAGC